VLERTRSALLIVPVVAAALVAGAPGIACLALLVAGFGGRETERLLAGTGRPVIRGGTAGGAIALVVVAALPPAATSLGLPGPAGDAAAAAARLGLVAAGLILVAMGLVALGRRDPADGFAAWAGSAFGAVYVGQVGAAAFLATPALWTWGGGPGWLAERAWPLVLVTAVWSFDSGAYLVGRAVGRRPFFAWISPKKTLEGVVGGLVVATIAVAAGLASAGGNPAEALLLGPLLGLAAQAGDLAESLLKRSAGAKDSGTLLPGHGGVLDRIDSFLFAAPVLAAYVALIHG